MKKTLAIVFTILLLITIIPNFIGATSTADQESIAAKIIRFHVIANSDTDADQNLKLKVRDVIISYLYTKLENSKNIDESREILKENNSKVLALATQVIVASGYSYTVTSSLDNENFPIKTYGNITLPSGNYEAYRIIIGSGQGHNWWCVMFPPLCFIDITKGEVSTNKTMIEMKKVLSEEEYDLIDNTIAPDKVVIKFKIFEILKGLF